MSAGRSAPLDDGLEKQALDLAPVAIKQLRELVAKGEAERRCEELGEAHGGRLAAAPNAPRGTVFSVTLPLQEMGEANGA